MLEFLLALSTIATVLGIFVAGFLSGAYYWYSKSKINKQIRKRTRKTNETSKTKNTLG